MSSGCCCSAVAAAVEGASVASSGLSSAHGIHNSTCVGNCSYLYVFECLSCSSVYPAFLE